MNKPQKELINYIRESLRDHEEPYRLGAWENFNGKKERRAFALFKYSAAAVVAAVGLYALLLSEYNFIQPSEKPLKNVTALRKAEPGNKKKESADHQPDYPRRYIKKKRTAHLIKPTVPTEISFVEKSTTKHLSLHHRDHTDLTVEHRDTMTIEKDPAISLSHKENKDPITTAEKKLEDTDDTELTTRTNKNRKWDFNIQLSSSVIKNTTVSAGVQIGYEVLDKVTLSSGLSVGTLASTTKSNQLLSTNRRLQSTDARLTGIEIPLEIKYSISPNLYTSVGMTSFAVLNDNRTNNYIEQVVKESVEYVSGQYITVTSVIDQEFSEKAPQSSFDNTNHVGFYSFSIGYKSKLSTKNTISIEPFMKIPARSLTDSDLKLENGGLRIKIGF